MKRKITVDIEKWNSSSSRKALVILGSRQVGKTYSVTEFGERIYGKQFLSIDFSNNETVKKAFKGNITEESVIEGLSAIYRDFRFVPGRTLLFFDEVQNCPDAWAAIKPLVKSGNYRVIASGSLLGIRMREVRLTPAGYVQRLDMHPMDFEEFLWSMNMPEAAISKVRKHIRDREPIEDALFTAFTELYNRYMVVGGMPDAVKAYSETRTFTDVGHVHRELFEEYLADIGKYADDSVRVITQSCLNAIPIFLAAENKKFVYSRIASKKRSSDSESHEGSSRAVGFEYYAPALEWLSMAHIALTCNNVSEPRNPLEERIKVNSFKLYMLDTGVLTSRYDSSVFQGIVFGNPDVNAGAIAENAIAQALDTQGRRLMYFKIDDPRMEIDFLTVVERRVCCIEVKSGKNRSCASMNRLMRDANTLGIMFETRNIFVDDKGVRHYPMFAASFMDEIDPRPSEKDNLGFLDAVIDEYGDDA